jgi:mono/diheme cytochrome c family protein
MIRFAALALFLAACSGSTAKDDTASDITGDAAAGADVYAANCVSCHGANGEGVSGPAMTEEVPEYDDAQLEDIIVNGTDGGMPAFGSLSDQDLADLVAYLRETFGG